MRTVAAAAFTLAATLIVLPAKADSPAGDADAILQATAKALGATNLASLPPYHTSLKGTAVGISGTADIWADGRSHAVAVDTNLGPLSEDFGFDGHDAWTRDIKGFVWVNGAAEGQAAGMNLAFRETYALWTPNHGGASVTSAGTKNDGGHAYDVVRVTPPGSIISYDMWIDSATHLPARYVETAQGNATTTTLSNYQTVAGIKFPFTAETESRSGNVTNFTVEHVDLNPPGIEAHLRKPASTVNDFTIHGADSTTIPFDLIDNHVYLSVKLNGKGPYRFIFDTGGANVIDPAVAREIGVQSFGNAEGGGAGSGSEQFSFGKVASLQVGDAELRDQEFAVLPIRAGFGVAGSAPVDGLIGFEVLARYVTVFDYAGSRVTLRMPGTGTIAGRTFSFVFGDTQPQVACTLDGIAGICSVDTGSRSSLDVLTPFVTAHPNLVPATATAAGVNGFGVGGAALGRLGRLGSLEIDGFELKNLIAGFSSQTEGFFSTTGIAANVGGGVWKRFTVTFDYAHQVMALAPNAAFAESDSTERSGIFAINRSGKIVVVSVRPGTPGAAAGIKEGDVITSLDGASGYAVTLALLRTTFHRASGTVVHLGIIHAGGTAPQDCVLTLADYV